MDSYKRNFYEEMTLKKLKDTLSKLKKEAEQIGKELPNLEGTEKEMRLKEYSSALEDIDEIKVILKQKQSEKNASKSETMEKLFPTVMKVAHKKSGKANIEAVEEESTEEDVVEEEVQEEVIEDTRTDTERLNDMYDDIKDILQDIDSEAEAVQSEIKAKVSEELSKGNTQMNVVEISVSKKTDAEKKDGEWKSLDELKVSQPVKENDVIIIDMPGDTSLKKAFNGDIATEVLASTEDELLTRPIVVLTEDMVKEMPKDEVNRERYRMDNFKKTLIRALNGIPKGDDQRKEILQKISVIEGNLSVVLKYS